MYSVFTFLESRYHRESRGIVDNSENFEFVNRLDPVLFCAVLALFIGRYWLESTNFLRFGAILSTGRFLTLTKKNAHISVT